MSVLQSKYELLTNYPDVARQWHPTKNRSKKPEEYRPGSDEKVWWLCDHNHPWVARIANRATLGRGCPYCAGYYASKDDNLLTNHPDIAKQWHPTKNGSKTPEEYRPASRIKVWWLCDQNHEWASAISNRTDRRNKNNDCPFCSGRKKTVPLN